MSVDLLQYIVAADLGLFAVICAGTGSLVKRAWANKVYEKVSNACIRDDATIHSIQESLRKAIENAASPFTVLGEIRSLLFFLSLLIFAMFCSQAVLSLVYKIMNPSANEHIIYTYTCVVGVAYMLVTVLFLLMEKTWQAIFTHVTLGGMQDDQEENS